MKKIIWTLLLTANLSFGFELSRDSIESSWTGGDLIWFRNMSPVPVTIKSIYVKRVSGNIGDGLLFKVSNEKREVNGGFTHWYQLRNSGDSLYVPAESWSQNPTIQIPPFDSISIKSILYGTCIFCTSSSQPYNYHVEIYFSAGLKEYVKLNLYGNFITGGIHKKNSRFSGIKIGFNYLLNGKIIEAQKNGKSSIRSRH